MSYYVERLPDDVLALLCAPLVVSMTFLILFGSGEGLKRRCFVHVVLEVFTLFRICDCFSEINHFQN